MSLGAGDLSDEERKWVKKLWHTGEEGLYTLRYNLTPIEPGDEASIYDRVKAIDFILQFDEEKRLGIDGQTAEGALE